MLTDRLQENEINVSLCKKSIFIIISIIIYLGIYFIWTKTAFHNENLELNCICTVVEQYKISN